MANIIKTVAVSIIGAVASYYATAWAKKALEEKPLKARVRDGKQKIVDIKDTAVEKALSMKEAAKTKADELLDGKKGDENV